MHNSFTSVPLCIDQNVVDSESVCIIIYNYTCESPSSPPTLSCTFNFLLRLHFPFIVFEFLGMFGCWDTATEG